MHGRPLETYASFAESLQQVRAQAEAAAPAPDASEPPPVGTQK